MYRTFIVVLLILGGIGSVIVSAGVSYEGYQHRWSFGEIGPVIAILAFAFSGAVGLLRTTGKRTEAAGASLIALVFIGFDIYGNTLHTGGTVDEKGLDYSNAVAAREIAQSTLPALQADIDRQQAELATVSGDDIPAAQRLLKSKGLYKGRIDGDPGGLTEKAMEDFGEMLRADIAANTDEARTLRGVIAAPLPPRPKASEGYEAIVLAFLLTLASSAASFFAGLVAAGRKREEEIERDVDDALGEVFQLHKYIQRQLQAA